MLVESIIAGLVVGFFQKDNFKKRLDLNWRGLYFPIIAVVLELALNFGLSTEQHYGWITKYTMPLHGAIYMLTLVFLLLNLRNPGVFVIYIGTLLNAIVIFANGGYMPVDISMPMELGYTEGVFELMSGQNFGHHVLDMAQTAWWWLGDVIHIRPPYPTPKTISLGDLFISLGVLLLLTLPLSKNSANFSTNRENTLEKGY